MMAQRTVFSLKEIQEAVDQVKTSTLEALPVIDAKTAVIQMADNIIRTIQEAYSFKKMKE
jgi:hypothetical protein